MVYKRPLRPSQSFIVALIWLALSVYILFYAVPTPYLWLVIAVSAFLVFYPIYKSLKS